MYRKIIFLSVVIGLAFTLLFELAPNFVLGIFGVPSNIPNPDAYWEYGRKTLRIFLSFITISCLVKVNSIFFQAAGKASHAVVSSLIRDVVCFVPLVLILPAIFSDVETILYVAPISDFIAMLVTAKMSAAFVASLRENGEETQTEEPILKPSKKGVIITIAREHGSAGKQIGQIVAQKLGIPFYYKEMMALAAQESGLHKEFIEEINTNSPSLLYGLYMSTEVVQRAVVAQETVIKKIAEMGSCVIVGRAADYVLKDREELLRVFVYAPTEFRIQRIMDVYGDSHADAAKNIKRSDNARATYYRKISNLAWGDKKNYDLIVNSAKGLEESADEICRRVLAYQADK
jgi:cytidylate kinase